MPKYKGESYSVEKSGKNFYAKVAGVKDSRALGSRSEAIGYARGLIAVRRR